MDVFISAVDKALQNYLVQRVQFPGSDAAVSFEAPTPEWAAQVRSVTVNLFLHRIERSNVLVRTPQRRFDANGRPDRRAASVAMIDLSYVVTVWCADATAEHELLSQVVSVLAATPVLPPDVVPQELASPLTVTFGSGEAAPAGPFSVAGPLKAYAALTVAVAADLEAQEEPVPTAGRAPLS